MVVAKSPFNFLAWEAHVVGHTEDGFVKAGLCESASSLSWHSVSDLQDWLSIPARPVLQNVFGPLILEQTSGAMDLPHARIAQGLDLTIKQCVTVLKHYGQTPAGKSKMDLYKQIFALFLESQEEQDDALHRSTMGKKAKNAANAEGEEEEEDEDFSDYEDLPEQAEETGNLGDPDLKREKAKVKKNRSKRALQEAIELLDKTRDRGRGRGKGKGRGRGRGRKGRGRGRGGNMPAEEPGNHSEETKEKSVAEEAQQETVGETKEKPAAFEQGSQEEVAHEAEASQKRKAESGEEARVEGEAKDSRGSEEAMGSAEAEAVAPAAARAGSHMRAPNLHETPGILADLCPPQGKIVLNHMDHRNLGLYLLSSFLFRCCVCINCSTKICLTPGLSEFLLHPTVG